MTSSLATVSYIGATILFILSLGGLANPETARRGNLFGIIGMTIAVLATIFGPRVTAAGIPYVIGQFAYAGFVAHCKVEEMDDFASGRFFDDHLATPQPRRDELPLDGVIVDFAK